MLQLKINDEVVEVKEGTRVIDLLADDENASIWCANSARR